MSRRANATDYRGQRVLLVGLGLHGGGVATVRWLAKQGAIVRVTDIQTATALAPSLQNLRGLKATYHLGGYKPSDWTWAQRIVLNPGVPPTIPEVQRAQRRGVPMVNEASIFLREFPGTAIGITGTRGKTTTTLLVGKILPWLHPRTIVSGNVRDIPMLDYLPKTSRGTWAVLELSSYQLERLPVAGRSLHIAVMTNLMVDHVNRHGSMSAYAQTKYNIFRGQTPDDVKVLNYHDKGCRRANHIGRGRVVWFGLQLPSSINGVTVRGGWVVEQKNNKHTPLVLLKSWHLPGQHNVNNLLAAVAVARQMGATTKVLQRAIKKFRGVPYRQEVIRNFHGHKFINDTSATSPDATLAAMAIYPRGVYILGGTDKSLDMNPLAQKITAQDISVVFLPGSATIKLQKLLRRYKYRRPLVTVQSMSSAVRTAIAMAQPGQEIILSPGAASFGLFVHEFDRGDKFNQSVQNL